MSHFVFQSHLSIHQEEQKKQQNRYRVIKKSDIYLYSTITDRYPKKSFEHTVGQYECKTHIILPFSLSLHLYDKTTEYGWITQQQKSVREKVERGHKHPNLWALCSTMLNMLRTPKVWSSHSSPIFEPLLNLAKQVLLRNIQSSFTLPFIPCLKMI